MESVRGKWTDERLDDLAGFAAMTTVIATQI
jgi:hypothetical protein